MNFRDALVIDKMIPIQKVNSLILKGSNEELTHRITLSNFTSLPVINCKQEIVGCIRTDVFLKNYIHDHRTKVREHISKLPLVSKDAYMTEVLRLANSDRPIIGIIDANNPKKLLGIVSTYQLIQQISHDVFSVI
ncbi:hypothetical protein FACS1894166_07130 [Bacilli bacterium]|nr:hypothetical protein FACS1894166_07130 [Bacilli bacterium]